MFYLNKKGNMKRLLVIGMILSLFISVGANPPLVNTDIGYNVELVVTECVALDVDVEKAFCFEMPFEAQLLEPFVEVAISYGNKNEKTIRYESICNSDVYKLSTNKTLIENRAIVDCATNIATNKTLFYDHIEGITTKKELPVVFYTSASEKHTTYNLRLLPVPLKRHKVNDFNYDDYRFLKLAGAWYEQSYLS